MLRLTPGVKVLMVLQAAVWLVSRPFLSTFVQWTAMVPEDVKSGQLWRLLTYPFVMGLWDLVFFAITLLFFGSVVEEFLGTRRFLIFCAEAAALAAVFLTAASLLVDSPGVLMGAATMDLAILGAYARTNPNQTIRLYMVLPLKAIHLLWIVVAFRIFTMWEVQRFLWPVAAELVAAAFGYWGLGLVRGRLSLADLNPWERYKNWQYRRKMLKFKVHTGGKKSDPSQYLH